MFLIPNWRICFIAHWRWRTQNMPIGNNCCHIFVLFKGDTSFLEGRLFFYMPGQYHFVYEKLRGILFDSNKKLESNQ